MGDFTLPPLPSDFVPNFLTQPNPINNDTNFPDLNDRIPLLNRQDDSREERFPKDNDNQLSYVDELHEALDNLAQDNTQQWNLSREQWVEAAALYSQSMVKGLITNSRGLGASSFRNDLSLESRAHLTELAKNIEKINRYFQIPYDEHTSTNYCSACLTAQGTTPTHWQTQLELCGHNATAAKDSILNQYIQTLITQMNEWYESQRTFVHDQIVLKITNDNFAPEILTADPRIIEWSNRTINDAQTRALQSIDQRAKQLAEDQFQSALIQYQVTHENDLARARDDLNHDLDSLKESHQQTYDEVQKEWQTKLEEARSRPIILDPIARKKRRGSVSTINSPTITKRQPLQPTDNNTSSIPPDFQPMPSTLLAPQAPVHVHASPQVTVTKPLINPDPFTQIMEMMNKQFDNLANRLNKLESNNNNEYTTWGTSTWGPNKNQDDQDALKDPYDAGKYDNLNYDDHALYDDPPNDTNFMSDAICSNEELHVKTPPDPDKDSDCMLLSDPPTPTLSKVAPSGLRPPERAQRVDFTSTKLATDSFGIPVGGRCNADGTISYDNANHLRKNKPKIKFAPLPEHMTPFTNKQLHKVSKDAIISHALFAFQCSISRNSNSKAQAIEKYKIAAANALKPGAKQTTLSFANVATKTPQTIPIQRQTTPSAWSKSPSPPPRPRNQPRTNNTTWFIQPRMGTTGLTTCPFDCHRRGTQTLRHAFTSVESIRDEESIADTSPTCIPEVEIARESDNTSRLSL
jgi:hypothetical protein